MMRNVNCVLHTKARWFGSDLSGVTFLLPPQVIDKNVFVTNVCPGPVRTAIAENALLKDGSTHNKKDPFIENGMTVQRCLTVTTCTVAYRFTSKYYCSLIQL